MSVTRLLEFSSNCFEVCEEDREGRGSGIIHLATQRKRQIMKNKFNTLPKRKILNDKTAQLKIKISLNKINPQDRKRPLNNNLSSSKEKKGLPNPSIHYAISSKDLKTVWFEIYPRV